MSEPADSVEFTFVADGDPTDEAISALAGLLLDIVNATCADSASLPNERDPVGKKVNELPKDMAS